MDPARLWSPKKNGSKNAAMFPLPSSPVASLDRNACSFAICLVDFQRKQLTNVTTQNFILHPRSQNDGFLEKVTSGFKYGHFWYLCYFEGQDNSLTESGSTQLINRWGFLHVRYLKCLVKMVVDINSQTKPFTIPQSLTHICLIFMVNVPKYTIHIFSSGYCKIPQATNILRHLGGHSTRKVPHGVSPSGAVISLVLSCLKP